MSDIAIDALRKDAPSNIDDVGQSYLAAFRVFDLNNDECVSRLEYLTVARREAEVHQQNSTASEVY
jgi:hypothetical protein